MASNRNPQKIQTSIRIIQVIMILICMILLGRIFQLQILDYETYAPLSKQNLLRMEVINPARGLIFDRNGAIMVENEPIYSITITPAAFDTNKVSLLSEILGFPESDVISKIRESQNYSWQRTSRLFTEVSFNVFSNIQENAWQLPGIGYQIESKRSYPLGILASHSFGYLREATREDYLNNEHIRLGDKIGKSGVELVFENFLRGEVGTEYLRVNAYGQALSVYNDGELNTPPKKGSDIVTTFDADLQKLAEELMLNKAGGLVALDPHTGEILSMVSSPQYNLEKLAGRLDNTYWAEVNTDSLRPLFNRAISSRQPPGSTLKPFMGLIGLHLGLITPSTTVYNSGAYIRGRAYADTAPIGNYDLEKSLALSSNTFHFWLMDRIGSQGYLNTWSNLIKDFGIGIRSEIDLPFEATGIIPDSTYMNNTFGARNWGIGDVINLGVGQGLVSVSPLQMAVGVSAIANNGYRVQPHLVRTIIEPDGTIIPTNTDNVKIDWIRQDHLRVVQNGMKRAVLESGARFYATVPDIDVAGKTGTAQNPHGQNHGWFIGYAPADNPQIAIAILIENGGFGSVSAAPIAGLMFEQYLTGEVINEYRKNYVLTFIPKPLEDND
jgi:penicillin-binding protein 2